MSERGARAIRSAGTLAAAVLLAVLAVAGAFLYYWYGMREAAPDGPSSSSPQAAPAPAVQAQEPMQVALHVPANGALVVASAGVRRQPEVQLQARETAAALLADQRSQLAPVLKDIRLRALYLDEAGTAYLDLSPGQPFIRASAWEELLAVYALVNTLMQNFGEIRQVRVLLDGKESQTLAGHIDLARSFVKRPDLVKP